MGQLLQLVVMAGVCAILAPAHAWITHQRRGHLLAEQVGLQQAAALPATTIVEHFEFVPGVAYKTWGVPPGISEIEIHVSGAGGASDRAVGGAGAHISARVKVEPGQLINVVVGEASSSKSAQSERPIGGGGKGSTPGGGASVVESQSVVLAVAAGGGGGGDRVGLEGGGGGFAVGQRGADMKHLLETLMINGGGGGSEKGGDGRSGGLNMQGGDSAKCGGGGGGWYGGGAGWDDLGACGAGGGGSSYVNTSALVGGTVHVFPARGSRPGVADTTQVYTQGVSWGQPGTHGHVAIQLIGSSLTSHAGCGLVSSSPAVSCLHAKRLCPQPASGFYWIRPTTSMDPIQMYCEMDKFGGGWTLLAHYCPQCSELDTSGKHAGLPLVQSSQSGSGRVSDSIVQQFGDDNTFWVRADSSPDQIGNQTGDCNTFYQLISPVKYNSSVSYQALRCSLNNQLFGAPFKPSGVGLTTQSGPSNWEKTTCGDPTKHSSQWVYVFPPNTVNGRDLCVNSGEDESAYKWLYLRPNDDSQERRNGPSWRVVAPADQKVICHDANRWPEDGHPLHMAGHISLDDCKAACAVQGNCTAIDYSANHNGAVDESGKVRSLCFFHESLKSCSNFKAFYSPTYSFEVWAFDDFASQAPVETTPSELMSSCDGKWDNINSLTRNEVIDIHLKAMDKMIATAQPELVASRIEEAIRSVVQSIPHEVVGTMRFKGLEFEDSWEMENGGKVAAAISATTGAPKESVKIIKVSSGSVIVDYGVDSSSPADAVRIASRLDQSISDGSFVGALESAGGPTCSEGASCDLESTNQPSVKLAVSTVSWDQVDAITSSEQLTQILRQLVDEQCRLLTEPELQDRLHEIETSKHKTLSELISREATIERIKFLSTTGQTVSQLKEAIKALLASDPVVRSVDSHGCVGILGFEWCGEKHTCIQNWAGGLGFPCSESTQAGSAPWESGLPETNSALLKTLTKYQLYHKTTTQLKEEVLQLDEVEVEDKPTNTPSKDESMIPEQSVDAPETCPPNSHGFPRCVCDDGFSGEINLMAGTGSCSKVECPPGSTNHPICSCADGHEGSMKWDDLIKAYVGTCAACPKGYWTTHGRPCNFVPGPPFTVNHPDLFCKAGFGGQIDWDELEGVYTGSCEQCTLGTWSTEADTSCRRISCPAGSIDWPTCRCMAGYEGKVAWSNGAYSGECSPCIAGSFKPSKGEDNCEMCPVGFFSVTGAAKCEAVKCPDNSSGHPDCRCDDPFVGQLKWLSGGAYAGSCKSQCEIGFLPNGDNTKCEPYVCPFNSLWPNCACREGYYGQIELSALSRPVGVCTQCPKGYWCPSGMTCHEESDCVRVDCPPNSADDHPHCACADGFTGAYTWDSFAGRYVGGCERCPATKWSNAESRRALSSSQCVDVACPFGAEGYPACQCKLGYVGSLAWDALSGSWAGSCAKCPKGTWSKLATDLKCESVQCPPKAINWPDCQCLPEFPAAEAIVWNEEHGLWQGYCGDPSCPANSVGYPNCQCAEGFFGDLKWDANQLTFTGECSPCPNGQWSNQGGECVVVKCPLDAGGWPDCKCNVGFQGTISTLRGWEYAGVCQPCKTGFWASDSGQAECSRVECPAHSSGHPNCQCDDGHFGLVRWLAPTGTWSGTCTKCDVGFYKPRGEGGQCERIECPAFSTGWPHCKCVDGYEGTLELLAGEPAFRGKCTRCAAGYSSSSIEATTKMVPFQSTTKCKPVICPDNSAGWPDCHCLPGFEGSVTLVGLEWLGSCVPCAPGFKSMLMTDAAYGPSKCVYQECPANSGAHPACGCKPGYAGQITWNTDEFAYTGSCAKCAMGTYSSAIGYKRCAACPAGLWTPTTGSSSCNLTLSCPNHATMDSAGACVCDNGFSGVTHLDPNTGKYLGHCDSCPPGHWSHKGSGCVKVECPANSFGHPYCMCPVGWTGRIGFDTNTGLYRGECKPCPHGKWSADGGACVNAACPALALSVSIPEGGLTCRCTNQTHGIINFDTTTGKFVGVCSPCPETGFAATADGTSCVVVPCPQHSSFHPECTCLPGTQGTLTWRGLQWAGTCTPCADGKWSYFSGLGKSLTCKDVPCPANSKLDASGSTCGCKDGFVGGAVWAKGAWKGGCTQESCPMNSHLVYSDEGESSCVCNDRYEGTLIRRSPGRYDGVCTPCAKGWVVSEMRCARVDCPPSAEKWPDCICKPGSIGSLQWAGTNYVGNCTSCGVGFASEAAGQCRREACPLGSHGHPDCTCEPPFVGEVTWNAQKQIYEGSCTQCKKGYVAVENTCRQVACPEGTTGWPDCTCANLTIGQVEWVVDRFVAKCQPCPVGSRTTHWNDCDPVPLPLHAFDAAHAKCEEGFSGTISWDSEAQTYTGTCTECASGKWSEIFETECYEIACPRDTTRKDLQNGLVGCECNPTTSSGMLEFSSGSWVGQCSAVGSLDPATPEEPPHTRPSASPSSAPAPSASPKPGTCFATQLATKECPVSCENDGTIGGKFSPMQCCNDNCWCVDSQGSEIAHSRHPTGGDKMTCVGITCLAQTDKACFGALGTKKDLQMASGSFFVEAWVKPMPSASQQSVPMVVFGSKSNAVIPFTVSLVPSSAGFMLTTRYAEASINQGTQRVKFGSWAHIAIAVHVQQRSENGGIAAAKLMTFVNGTQDSEMMIPNPNVLDLIGWQEDAVLFGHDETSVFRGSLGTIRFWRGRPTQEKLVACMRRDMRSLDRDQLMAQFEFADDGFGLPQLLLSGGQNIFTQTPPRIECASLTCTDEPRFLKSQPQPSPSPSPMRGGGENKPLPPHHVPKPQQPSLKPQAVAVNPASGPLDFQFGDVSMHLQPS